MDASQPPLGDEHDHSSSNSQNIHSPSTPSEWQGGGSSAGAAAGSRVTTARHRPTPSTGHLLFQREVSAEMRATGSAETTDEPSDRDTSDVPTGAASVPSSQLTPNSDGGSARNFPGSTRRPTGANTISYDSLAETAVDTVGGNRNAAAPPLGRPSLTHGSSRNNGMANTNSTFVAVPPTTNHTATVRAAGDSLAYPPDAYAAVAPMRKRSAIITGAKPYQPVADDPNLASHRAFLIRMPSTAGPQQQQCTQYTRSTPNTRNNMNDNMSMGTLSPPLGKGSGSLGHASGKSVENATTTSVVIDGQAMSNTSFIPPTAADPTQQPSLVAAYLKGNVNAEVTANDPINNYTFFIGGTEVDNEDEKNIANDERCPGNRNGSGGGGDSSSFVSGSPTSSIPVDGTSHNTIGYGCGGRANSSMSDNPLSFNEGGENSREHAPYGGSSYDDVFNGGRGLSLQSPSGGPTPTATTEPGRGVQLDLNEAAALVENLSRSFAMNRNGFHNSPLFRPSNVNRTAGNHNSSKDDCRQGVGDAGRGSFSNSTFHLDPLPLPGHDQGVVGSYEPANRENELGEGGTADSTTVEKPPVESYINMDAFGRLPMPQYEPCRGRCDLDDDSVSYVSVWQSIKSEAVSRNVLSGLRITLFAVMPMFVLTKHPNTAGWFKAGVLLPIIAGLFVKPNVGAQVWMTILGLQACAGFLLWGTIMNAMGTVNHLSAWWCGVIFAPFCASMLGDVASKRLIMMYVIIVMQMEHVPGGSELAFPAFFARDFLIAVCVAFAACLLPYPILAVRQLTDAMVGLHKLYGAGVGNAMKAYWAPVNIDQKAALGQVPFAKIRDLTGQIKMLIYFAGYEPSEFNLNNILRGERLGMLQCVKMHLYQMAAAASQRVGEGQKFTYSTTKEVRDFEKRVKGPGMELATEIIEVLSQLGKHTTPEDVATKVDYDNLYNRAAIVNDIVERERARVFFLRQHRSDDTNSYLRTFAFLGSLVDIAAEIEKLEVKMRSFDPSQYPSFWRRSYNFLLGDSWRDFWEELPKRLTLATPRDVRLLKDSIKYTLGFAVACAFTLNYDHTNVYYFGMAILVRLAQQTASETLSVGIYRICGLCIGASVAYITYSKTHNLAEETLLTMAFVFIAMCFATHPVYCWGAQYLMVISITGLSLAPTPSLLLTRMVDNVFAFISYFLICTLIFPVDPIRILWNIRTKLFLNINALTQTFVTLGCAPVTMDGAEALMFLAEAKKLAAQQPLLLTDYGALLPKCESEPILRGGVYPHPATVKLLLYLSEACSLQEAMVDAMARLHRVRDKPPSTIVHDVMELTRPFLLDIGKIFQRYLQCMIDATEVPGEWSMAEAIDTLWRAQIACRSLRHVTGNIQRNFFAAVQQITQDEKDKMNVYLPASMVIEALSQENDPRLLNPENEELLQRLFAMSFHMSRDSMVSRDDMQAFSAIVIVVELILKVLGQMLPYMVEIHEFEKSRVM